MKIILALILLIGPFLSIAQNKNISKKTTFYCHARGGLSLRSLPDFKADKDTLVSYGDSVRLLSIGDTTFRVNGLEGTWFRVKYEGKTGFVFSGYLSRHPLKVAKGKHVYLKDFAYNHYTQTSGDKEFEMEEYMEDEKVALFGDMRYQLNEGGYCDLEEKLYVKGMGVQEALMIFASYTMDYNSYTFKRRKFDYDRSYEKYNYSFTKENKDSFSQHYYMSYTLNEDGSYATMSVSFDWEGGGGTLSVYKWSESMVCVEHSYSCH